MRRLYVRDEAAWQRECAKQHLVHRELQVTEVPFGILLPPEHWQPQTGAFKGGVCDRQGNFVAGLFRSKPPQAGFYGVGEAYPVAEPDLQYVDRAVIFGGILIGHFGHFILECLGRLWYVLTRDEPQKPLVFLTELEDCSWYGDFFDLLAIPRERICFVKQPTRFRSVTVPEEAVHSWYAYTPEYLLPYHLMVKRAQEITKNRTMGPKIFLTRHKLADSQTKCINEEYFCDFYARLGFVPVELETLPLGEQVSIVANAREIAAVLGSLTHWALFCHPGTRFTMLTRTSNDILGSQCLINEAAQMDWYIVDTAMNLFYANRAVGVCLIGPTIWWQEYVRDMYGEWKDDGSWQQAYHTYLREWTDYMLQPDKWDTVKSLEPLALLTRINRALHQNEMSLQCEKTETNPPGFMLVEGELAYYWSEETARLQSRNLVTGEIATIYKSPVHEAPAPLYGMLVQLGDHIVLVPENARAVLDYDTKMGTVAEIALPAPLPRGNFRYALVWQDKVLMIGYYSPQILAYRPASGELGGLVDFSPVEFAGKDEKLPAGGKPCLLGDKLYLPIIDTNRVAEVNLSAGSHKIHQVGVPEAAYGFAVAYAGNIWLVPSQGGPLAVWNPPTGVLQVFGDFPQGFSFNRIAGRIRFFTDALACGRYLWLLPWGANQFLRLNMETGNFRPLAMSSQVSEQQPRTYCGCVAGNRIFVWLSADAQIHVYDE